MTIEFSPPALQGVIESKFGVSRVRNREGYLVTTGDEANAESGLVWDLYQKALELEGENPDGVYTLYEHGCMGEGIPASILSVDAT